MGDFRHKRKSDKSPPKPDTNICGPRDRFRIAALASVDARTTRSLRTGMLNVPGQHTHTRQIPDIKSGDKIQIMQT